MQQQSLFGSMVATVLHQDTASETPLHEALFTVIDLETTGLNSQKNAITEITAIQFRNDVEVDKYSTLVKPTETIPPEVENITGISNEMVANAPPLIIALSDLCNFVGLNPLIVGHNVSFDLRFIREKLDVTGLATFIPRFDPATAFCTKLLAQRAFPGLPSYEGVVVANHCGIHNPNPHRAEYDVRMSAGILFSIISHLRSQEAGMVQVQHLSKFQGDILL